MLLLLRSLQLVFYVAGLALAGQGVLYVLAGAAREGNVFYRVLRTVARPLTWTLRRVLPRTLPDRQVAVLTFALVWGAYLAVTLELIGWCASQGMAVCR